jgi:hypothetical protein
MRQCLLESLTGQRLGCRRTTDDPLLRLFIDHYHLHLLTIPRQGSTVGDLYIERDGVVGTPGYIGEILSPGFELPKVRIGERLADITGQITRSVDPKVGVKIAEQLLSVVGIPADVGLSAAFSRAGGARFRFHDVFRDSVDVLALGRVLAQHMLVRGHPAVSDQARFYLTTAVLTTEAISIVIEGASGVDLQATAGAAGVGSEASISVHGANEISLNSTVPLAFAVELYELQFNLETGTVQLRKTAVAVRVRGERRTVTRERLVAAQIGGADGDLFLPSR